VPSGVTHTPLSRAELMAGARGRALALARMAAERSLPWRYFVGLEGGLEVMNDKDRRMAFLETWAYVCDSHGRGAYGHSGGLLLPEALAIEVIDRGRELSAAIDEYAGSQGIRDGQGVSGVLTDGLITRQDIVRMAVIHAFAPFFNVKIYGSSFAGSAEGGTRIEN